MAQNADDICTLARQAAKARGYETQSGQLLNEILGELCQDYDLDLAMKTFYFNFDPGLRAILGNSIYGSGPYPLPADFLRNRKGGVWWTLQGVPYKLIPIDLEEFDSQVQQAGNQSYPTLYTTDLSLADETAQGLTTPAMYVYMPPSGAYPATVRYQCQMADITSPETSATPPWFPNSAYLRTELTARLMSLTGDDRAQSTHAAAVEILRLYLGMKDDKTTRAQTIGLDKRVFGPRFSDLPNTKTVGW